jgi:site-specific DNA-methyltransferase (adenine-specific)
VIPADDVRKGSRRSRRTPAGPKPVYVNRSGTARLLRGDSLQILPRLPEYGSLALVFADPPYFLSNDGVTCRSGRMAPVNKGAWDRLRSVPEMHAFNRRWLEICRDGLADDGSLWVSGTRHVIFSVGFAMQELGMKVLNDITWEKPNPPPNLSCRYFTHATETLLWAAKHTRSRHLFNYQEMRAAAGGKQMKSVWRMSAPGAEEKTNGRHPTQKPLALLERIINACTRPGDTVVDPFAGSATTGVAALKLERAFIGIESDPEYVRLAERRLRASEPES